MNSKHRLLAALLVVFGIAARPVAGQDQRSRIDARSLGAFRGAAVDYEKANELFAKGDLPGARARAAAALQLAPELSDAHFLMARILYAEKEDAKALEEILTAEGDYRSTSLVKERMQQDLRSRLARLREEKEKSIDACRSRMGAIPPEKRPGLEAKIERVTRAKEVIDRQLVEMPRFGGGIPADYHFVHGHILLRLNDHDGAMAQYEEAMNRQPRFRFSAPAPTGGSPGC